MSKPQKIIIREIESVTHDVHRIVATKPAGYDFKPGQATEVAVATDGWRDAERPFTFTSLTRDPMLEFTIKIYPEREGVTDRIGDLEPGDSLLIEEPFGAIQYRGKGTFLAGGAGITPFIAIIRQLHADGDLEGHRLLFVNHRREDVILRGEMRRLFGDDCQFLLSAKDADSHVGVGDDYLIGCRIDRQFLKTQVTDFKQYFYVCGPPQMVTETSDALVDLGADKDRIVIEQ